MSRVVQVFNPVHGQKVWRQKMNVMGKVIKPGLQNVSVLLDRRLLRRVKVAHSGMFECRILLDKVPLGKHELEVRAITGHRTERLMVPFYLVESPPDKNAPQQPGVEETPPVRAESTDASSEEVSTPEPLPVEAISQEAVPQRALFNDDGLPIIVSFETDES